MRTTPLTTLAVHWPSHPLFSPSPPTTRPRSTVPRCRASPPVTRGSSTATPRPLSQHFRAFPQRRPVAAPSGRIPSLPAVPSMRTTPFTTLVGPWLSHRPRSPSPPMVRPRSTVRHCRTSPPVTRDSSTAIHPPLSRSCQPSPQRPRQAARSGRTRSRPAPPLMRTTRSTTSPGTWPSRPLFSPSPAMVRPRSTVRHCRTSPAQLLGVRERRHLDLSHNTSELFHNGNRKQRGRVVRNHCHAVPSMRTTPSTTLAGPPGRHTGCRSPSPPTTPSKVYGAPLPNSPPPVTRDSSTATHPPLSRSCQPSPQQPPQAAPSVAFDHRQWCRRCELHHQLRRRGPGCHTGREAHHHCQQCVQGYGAALPSYSASYSGFVNSYTSASLTKQPTFSTTATASSAVGSYSITASRPAVACQLHDQLRRREPGRHTRRPYDHGKQRIQGLRCRAAELLRQLRGIR